MPRGHPAQALVHEIDESREIEHLALEPMSRDELFDLVEKLDGERPTLGFMAAVMEGSGGNPLIAGQLVEAQRRLAGPAAVRPARRDHPGASAAARPTAGPAAAPAGHRPPSRQPGAPCRRSDSNDGHLPAAVAERCIESGLAIESDQGLSIVHELCSEAITQATLPAERHELHAALAAQVVTEPAEAAWHWMRALQARTGPSGAPRRGRAVRADRARADDADALLGGARAWAGPTRGRPARGGGPGGRCHGLFPARRDAHRAGHRTACRRTRRAAAAEQLRPRATPSANERRS